MKTEKPQYITNRGEKATQLFNEFAVFRKNLFMLRQFNSMSGEELASAIELSPKKILDYETGRMPPSFDHIRKIAKFFNVTIDEIIYKEAKLTFE